MKQRNGLGLRNIKRFSFSKRRYCGQVMAEYLIVMIAVSLSLYLVLVRGGEVTIGQGPNSTVLDVPSVTESLSEREHTYRHAMYLPLTTTE